MERSFVRILLRHLLILFFSLPFSLVSIMVLFGPSSFDDGIPSWFSLRALEINIVVVFTSFCLFIFLLRQKRLIPFIASYFVISLVLISLSLFAGLKIHRDFFSSAFQYILCIPVLFFYQAKSEFRTILKGVYAKNLGSSGFVLSILYTQWILMMGYAISTRAEPRPVESIIYNIYNVILVIVLFISSREIRLFSYTSILISSDSLTINDKDMTDVAGSRKLSMLYALSKEPQRRLNCEKIQQLQISKIKKGTQDCSDCLDSQSKAALCSTYRSTYNTILELKKLLEALEIGSITSNGSRRDVLKDGWKLVVFENIRLTVQ